MTHTTRPDGRTWGVYCISAGRPANVSAIQAQFAPDPVIWVVPHAERHDYATAGAHTVLPVALPAPGHYQLPTQRQAALTHALTHKAACIQTDDDLRRFKRVAPTDRPKHFTAHPAAWAEVRDALLDALDGTAHLAGLTPTDNTLFSQRSSPYWGLVRACITAADSPAPAWDTTLPLKEDYDYTCAHIETYGRVNRVLNYIATYAAYSNRGGAVALRTPDNEAHAARQLLARWPQYLRPHRSRAHEVGFRPQPRDRRVRP